MFLLPLWLSDSVFALNFPLPSRLRHCRSLRSCRYYVKTALPTDQFFSATGGAGYSYPWSLPSPEAYFTKAAELNTKFMPADNWYIGRLLSLVR